MTEAQRAAIAAIESQQPQKHNTVWMAGEQLKEIARSERGRQSCWRRIWRARA